MKRLLENSIQMTDKNKNRSFYKKDSLETTCPALWVLQMKKLGPKRLNNTPSYWIARTGPKEECKSPPLKFIVHYTSDSQAHQTQSHPFPFNNKYFVMCPLLFQNENSQDNKPNLTEIKKYNALWKKKDFIIKCVLICQC